MSIQRLMSLLVVVGCGSSAPISSSQGDSDGGAGGGLADAQTGAAGLQVVRMYLTIPQLADESVDPMFPAVCPEGEDCFLSASFHRNGQFEFDDLRGRVSGQLDQSDHALLTELFFVDGAWLGPRNNGRFDCPGVPADYSVSAVFGARFADGLEIMDAESAGCVAGELNNLEKHPLAQLRRLVEESRLRYVDCSEPAADTEGSTLRALCKPEFVAVRKW